MKIGILISDLQQSNNWEWRIIDHIRQRPEFELALVIKPKSATGTELPAKGLSLSRRLLNWQAKVESRFKKFKEKHTVDREAVDQFLHGIASLELSPESAENNEVDRLEAIRRIEAADLDLLLNLGFRRVGADLAKTAKQGVWSFQHVVDKLNSGYPGGFGEVLQKQAVISAALVALAPDGKSYREIDRAFYNISFSYVRNNFKMSENAVALLFRNLQALQEGRLKLPPAGDPLPPTPFPSLAHTLKYLLKFYRTLAEKAYRSLLEKTMGVRFDCWTLFLGEGDFFDAELSALQPTRLPKGEYWADPFLFEHEGEKYVFFENFSYSKQRGKISCGKLKNGALTEVEDVLVKPYHMSYPFIFREEGEIFLMPEMNQNKCLEIYRCVEFPGKWELYAKAFDGLRVVDTTYFRDDAGDRWLFLNRQMDDLGMGYGSELYIYKIDSLRMTNIQAHRQNPVLLDARIARGAGPIFKKDGQWIRPSQNNSNGIYGFGLNLNLIKKLDLEEYREERILEVMPDFGKGIISTHHLHQLNGNFVLDAAYSKY